MGPAVLTVAALLALAQAADAYIDECATQVTCVRAGQACEDPDKESAGDWMCVCVLPWVGAEVGAPAACTFDTRQASAPAERPSPGAAIYVVGGTAVLMSLVGGGRLEATRFVLAAADCVDANTTYPAPLHPTRWDVDGVPALGTVVGGLLILLAGGVLLVVVRWACVYLAENYYPDLFGEADISGFLRFPSLHLSLVQVLYQGLALGVFSLLFDPATSELARVVGVLGLLACIAGPVYLVAHTLPQVLENVTLQPDPHAASSALRMAIGDSEWVSLSITERHAKRWGAILHRFVPAGVRPWNAATFGTAMFMGMLHALSVSDNTWTTCGHTKLWSGLTLLALTASMLCIRPFRAHRVAVAEVVQTTLETIALLACAAGYFEGDINSRAFGVGGFFMWAAGVVRVLIAFADMLAELVVVLVIRRRIRLQRAWEENPTARIPLDISATRSSLHTTTGSLQVGPAGSLWRGNGLVLDIDRGPEHDESYYTPAHVVPDSHTTPTIRGLVSWFRNLDADGQNGSISEGQSPTELPPPPTQPDASATSQADGEGAGDTQVSNGDRFTRPRHLFSSPLYLGRKQSQSATRPIPLALEKRASRRRSNSTNSQPPAESGAGTPIDPSPAAAFASPLSDSCNTPGLELTKRRSLVIDGSVQWPHEDGTPGQHRAGDDNPPAILSPELTRRSRPSVRALRRESHDGVRRTASFVLSPQKARRISGTSGFGLETDTSPTRPNAIPDLRTSRGPGPRSRPRGSLGQVLAKASDGVAYTPGSESLSPNPLLLSPESETVPRRLSSVFKL